MSTCFAKTEYDHFLISKLMKTTVFKAFYNPIWILLVVFLQGCIVVPKAATDENPRCQLFTNKLTLDVYQVGSPDADQVIEELDRLSRTKCDKPECLLVYAPIVTVAAGSAVVSGSIVIIGNTLHWLEEQGRCDESAVHKAVNGISEMAIDAGGWVVQSTRELIDWFSTGSAEK
jgi:hypothetical protein